MGVYNAFYNGKFIFSGNVDTEQHMWREIESVYPRFKKSNWTVKLIRAKQ